MEQLPHPSACERPDHASKIKRTNMISNVQIVCCALLYIGMSLLTTKPTHPVPHTSCDCCTTPTSATRTSMTLADKAAYISATPSHPVTWSTPTAYQYKRATSQYCLILLSAFTSDLSSLQPSSVLALPSFSLTLWNSPGHSVALRAPSLPRKCSLLHQLVAWTFATTCPSQWLPQSPRKTLPFPLKRG